MAILTDIWEWIKDNYVSLTVGLAVILISTIAMIIIVRYIRRLENKKKLTESYSKVLTRIVRGIYFLVFIFSVLTAFNVTIGAITGAIALLGGSILGFASINTLGNALAGLIIMVSKPIHIGDRIFINDLFADVISIEIIYTKLKTLDKATIVIPNQQLLTGSITNYGKDEIVSRQCKITAAFEEDSEIVENLLLKAVTRVVGVLEEPTPTVRLTDFQNFAVEYKVFYSVQDIKNAFQIDSNVKKSILQLSRELNVDLKTPNLSQLLPNE